MTSFPRFGPNGAYAFFSDERDVPPGWQPTAEHAQRMQTLGPPPFADKAGWPPMIEATPDQLAAARADGWVDPAQAIHQPVLQELGQRMSTARKRKGRRK